MRNDERLLLLPIENIQPKSLSAKDFGIFFEYHYTAMIL
jgi:hypothetical protein